MYWLAASLFLIGTVCGATIRLMAFIVVLLGGAAIAIAVSVSHYWLGCRCGTELPVIATVVMLQIGYAAGLVLRCAFARIEIPAGEKPSEPRAKVAGARPTQ